MMAPFLAVRQGLGGAFRVDVLFFETSALLDHCCEHRRDRGRIQRSLSFLAQTLEERALPRRVVDGETLVSLSVADGKDHGGSLPEQPQKLMVNAVDLEPQPVDLRVLDHGRRW
jgi:hypothetical protein